LDGDQSRVRKCRIANAVANLHPVPSRVGEVGVSDLGIGRRNVNPGRTSIRTGLPFLNGPGAVDDGQIACVPAKTSIGTADDVATVAGFVDGQGLHATKHGCDFSAKRCR